MSTGNKRGSTTPVTLLRPYCTLEEVQMELGNENSYENNWLLDCINRASRWVEEKCHRQFWYFDYRSNGFRVPTDWLLQDEFYLPWPCLDVDNLSVEQDDEAVSTDVYDFTNPPNNQGTSKFARYDDSWWDLHAQCRDGERPRIPGFTSPLKPTRVVVKGLFGYELNTAATSPDQCPPTNLPSGINRAAILVASAFSALKRRETIKPDGQQINTIDTFIPKDARRVIRKWRWNVTM